MNATVDHSAEAVIRTDVCESETRIENKTGISSEEHHCLERQLVRDLEKVS